MKKLILLLIVLFSFQAWSQDQPYDEKVYFSDAEYFFVQEFYMDALTDFLEVYNHGNENNANLNYLIGICYLNIPGQKEKSIPYFEKAKPSVSPKYKKSSLKEEFAPLDLYLFLGNAYRISEQFDKAIAAYKKYLDLIKYEKTAEHDFALLQIKACENAKQSVARPLNIALINIGEPINNSYPNFNPVLSGDGAKMVYMSRLPFYDAIFLSQKVDGVWGTPINLTPEIQSDGDQYICDISFDGKTILLSKEEDLNSDIYISHANDDGVWGKSTPIESINTRYWESHASFSKDAKTIYFTSNRAGGKGGSDIYYIEKTGGVWGKPKNIGTPINTELNEDVPFISADGSKLYFSSQRENTIGGYDIFVSEKTASGEWGEPKNMGYPINTTDDDLFLYPHDNGKKPYTFRYLKDGLGEYDIVYIGEPEDQVISEPIAQKVTNEPEGVEEPEQKSIQETIAETEESNTETVTKKETVEEQPTTTDRATVIFEPIYFGFNEYTLDISSLFMLDKIADVMNADKNINLEISGHTDAFGSMDYNINLSKKRATAAEKYLASKGISKTRIKISAKHSSKPLIENDLSNKNAPQNKYNRRVEFKLSNYNKNELEIKYNYTAPGTF